MIPLGDYAGEIVAFGPDTDPGEWRVGDRVCPFPFVAGEGMTGETRIGAACESARMPVANLIRIPNGVSDVHAASLPIAYGTAQRMLGERGRIARGEKVLVLGFARLGDYARERPGLSARELHDLAHVDAALAKLPAIGAALASGRLGWTKARLLCRVATPEDEAPVARRRRAGSRRRRSRARCGRSTWARSRRRTGSARRRAGRARDAPGARAAAREVASGAT